MPGEKTQCGPAKKLPEAIQQADASRNEGGRSDIESVPSSLPSETDVTSRIQDGRTIQVDHRPAPGV